jgi:hypothetical protein
MKPYTSISNQTYNLFWFVTSNTSAGHPVPISLDNVVSPRPSRPQNPINEFM